jgi:hypothetical protein
VLLPSKPVAPYISDNKKRGRATEVDHEEPPNTPPVLLPCTHDGTANGDAKSETLDCGRHKKAGQVA